MQFNGNNLGFEVILNVYDLASDSMSKTLFSMVGLGFYHSGVEINGIEYTYGGNYSHNGTGVYNQVPLQAAGATYKESYLIGEVKDFSKI